MTAVLGAGTSAQALLTPPIPPVIHPSLHFAVSVIMWFLPLLAASAWPSVAAATLDLVPDVFDVSVHIADVGADEVTEGCAGGTTARRLVRFALRIRNAGPDDLLVGEPLCPECPTNPGAICANPLFFCSPAHGHAHFRSFVGAAMLDRNGVIVAEGQKFGFCLVDSECTAPATPQFTDCGYQGISAGCADVYLSGLGCQYVDITDVDLSNGPYTLQVAIDPLNVIAETDEPNNVTTLPVELCGVPSTCPVYTASDVPQAIPDSGTASSSINVPSGRAVSSVAIVGLRGTHTFVSDLAFRLRAPGGTEVTALDRVCGVDDDFHLDLDETACSDVTCPPTDGLPHRPSQPLAFDGVTAAGPWTLAVDDLAAADTGTLDGWGLRICSCGDGSLAAGEECDDGNGTNGDGCSDTCRLEACGPVPRVGCRRPDRSGRARILLRNDPDAARNELSWKWLPGSTTKAEFGAPAATTGYQLCVYRGTAPRLLLSLATPVGGSCGAGACWSETKNGFVLRDPAQTSGPFRRATLRGSSTPEKAQVFLQAKGPGVDLPPLSALTSPLTVQLVNRETGVCWDAEYSFPPAQRHDATRFSDSADP